MARYLLLILFALISHSCHNISGSGNVITQKRNVPGFSGILVNGSINVEVVTGSSQSVEVEADDNVLPDIITEVEDDMLNVHFRPNMSFTNVHAVVFVTAPGLTKLFVRGSGNIKCRDRLKSRLPFNTSISGSGDIDANVDALEVTAEITGSGNLSLAGRCKNFEGSISGSGDLKCKNLLSENSTIKIAGSGTAHVYASINLNASIAGSGDIYYSGNPTSTKINKGGSGNVSPEK